MKKMSVAFVGVDNPIDIKNWSGTPYHMIKSLQKSCQKVDIYYWKRLSLYDFIFRIISYFSKKVFKKNFDYKKAMQISKIVAKNIRKKLKQKNYDLIICNASFPIAYLDIETPIVIYSDSAFGLLLNTHENRNYYRFLIQSGREIENRGFSKAKLIIFASHWAKNFAKHHYPLHSDKMHCIPFGANIESVPKRTVMDYRIMNNKICNLLFLAVNWKAKGGSIVIETFRILKKRGFKVHLTICGCNPSIDEDNLTIIPFLNKTKDRDQKDFDSLLIKSHFMFVPTKAEAYGIVFAEACAYGMPSITTNIGGISTIINNGFNGFLFSLDSRPFEYADAIEKAFLNRKVYEKLCFNARNRYETLLNWDIAMRTLITLGNTSLSEQKGLLV